MAKLAKVSNTWVLWFLTKLTLALTILTMPEKLIIIKLLRPNLSIKQAATHDAVRMHKTRKFGN